MAMVVIYRDDNLTVNSWGNGFAYELAYEPERAERGTVFMQGEDADIFRGEWQCFEAGYPEKPIADFLLEYWLRCTPND
jgi:hypothetical protein